MGVVKPKLLRITLESTPMTTCQRGYLPSMMSAPGGGYPLYHDVSAHLRGEGVSAQHDVSPQRVATPFMTSVHRGGIAYKDVSPQRGVSPTYLKVFRFTLNARGQTQLNLTFSKPMASTKTPNLWKNTSHPCAQSTHGQTEHRHQNLGNDRRNQAIQSRFRQTHHPSRHLPIVPLRIHPSQIR